MAITTSPAAANLFLVLTGEQWPSANEDHLRALAEAWERAGGRTEDELGPLLVAAVHKIRADFTGKSAIKFAEVMAPYVEGPGYVPAAAGQFRDLGKFLADTAMQVEYVKLISIVTLVELLAEIAWAVAMSGVTSGGSMSWLAARMAVVRFLLRTWWGRLILRIVQAQVMGVAFQVAMDAIVQAIQLAEGHRDHWDVNATVQAVGVGALGGALSLPLSGLGHALADKLTHAVVRVVGRDAGEEQIAAVVGKAVGEHGGDVGKAPVGEVAEKITTTLMKEAAEPLRVRLAAAGTHAVVDAVEEGLHETITEGTYMAAQGQGFQFNPFSFTSGVFSSFTHPIGHGIGHLLGSHEAEGFESGGEHGAEKEKAPLPFDAAPAGTADALGGLDAEPSRTDAPASTPPPTRPSSPTPLDPGGARVQPAVSPATASLAGNGSAPASATGLPGQRGPASGVPAHATSRQDLGDGPVRASPPVAEATANGATPKPPTSPSTAAPSSAPVAHVLTGAEPAPVPANGTSAGPRPTAPGLSPEVTRHAVDVDAGHLDRLTHDDLAGAERLVVRGDGALPPAVARDAAGRLGVDVVALVDRAALGNGRRQGERWMTFPGNGGRPKPVGESITTLTTPSASVPARPERPVEHRLEDTRTAPVGQVSVEDLTSAMPRALDNTAHAPDVMLPPVPMTGPVSTSAGMASSAVALTSGMGHVLHGAERADLVDLAERLPADPSAYTFVASGSAQGVADEHGEPLSPEAFADVLKTLRPPGDTRPVRLVVCDIARDGHSSYAARVASALGVPVLAPSSWVWQPKAGGHAGLDGLVSPPQVTADGVMLPAPVLPTKGAWLLFRPRPGGVIRMSESGPALPADLGAVVNGVPSRPGGHAGGEVGDWAHWSGRAPEPKGKGREKTVHWSDSERDAEPPVPEEPAQVFLPPDPLFRSIGVPRAGLPGVPDVIVRLQAAVGEAGVQVPQAVWDALPQRLLSNYRYLLPDAGAEGTTEQGVGGLLVPLGTVEALISLDPRNPAGDPARSSTGSWRAAPVDGSPDHRANETINAAYATGAHMQTQSGQTSASRGAVSVTFGAGLTPGMLSVARAGASISGTANQSNRTTSHVADAEGGHVEDNRADSVMIAYTANWSMKIRTDPDRPWAEIEGHTIDTGTEKLLLYVPEHYLQQASDHAVAVGAGVRDRALPSTYYASGLTALPRLFDEIATLLNRQGLALPVGNVTRDELLQKLWNLDAHLDEAVNDANGYSFLLHNRHGKPVASVVLHTERLPDGVRRVGRTTDKAHLENVRTAIDGTGGSHTLTHTSTVTPLNVEFDLLPAPSSHPDLGLGISGYGSLTWSNTDSLSAGRNGLWVVVPRYAGQTTAYRVGLRHRAEVSLRRNGVGVYETGWVEGQALVRMPEPDAFEHGFPVDREALTDPTMVKVHTDGTATSPFLMSTVRNTGRRLDDPAVKEVPPHVAPGRGIGMGLPSVRSATVAAILDQIKPQLIERGFIPADERRPFAGRRWWQHGSGLNSRLDNMKLLEKMISQRGLDSYYDQIHQDGMVVTLRRRRGVLGVGFGIDTAKVTITATPSDGRPPVFVRSTDEYHTVNLAMGMDTAGQAAGGSRTVAVGFRAKTLFRWLKAAVTGVELQRTVGATDAVGFLNNRPELLEYPGRVDEFRLTSDYRVGIQYRHSGLRGWFGRALRDRPDVVIGAQPAVVRVLPLGGDGRLRASLDRPTPPRVLDQAAIYYLDTTGTREAARAALGEMVGAAGTADQHLDAFAGTISMRAYLKEIVNGEYTTDQPFEPGLFRNTFGAIDIAGAMGPSTFTGATSDKFVLGIIKLWLAQASSTDTSSKGVTWDQVDGVFGGIEGAANLAGEFDINRHWQTNRSLTSGRTGGKELIQLDFNRVYSYQTTVDLTVRSRQEKHGKLWFAARRQSTREVNARDMVYLLPEPEALERYAAGDLPVSDDQLADALDRWRQGELPLNGDVVARILMRRRGEGPETPATAELVRHLAGTHAAYVALRASNLAESLGDEGAAPVSDPDIRERFNTVFQTSLADPGARPAMPEYLTRDDPGGRILGHSGIYDVGYEDGRSTYQIVREHVDRVAPGLLTAGAEVWDRDGRVIGHMQGGIDALQGVFARGRDQAMWEDLLSPNGHSFYLVNPVGGLLADVVEINLADVLISAPVVRDFKPNTGLENYGHGYVSVSETTSRDGSLSVVFPQLDVGRAPQIGDSTISPPPSNSGAAGLGHAEGHHRSTTRAETATTEQTVYDWSGHYRVMLRHELTITVRRLDMAGRPLNNFLMSTYRTLAGQNSGEISKVRGSLELEVPRALAESPALRGPAPIRDFAALPELPGDAYLTGTLLDEAVPVARKLLAQVFGRNADSAAIRGSLSVPVLLSRSHMTNHLMEASAGRRYHLASDVFIPGHSSERASLWLSGELYDLEVIAPIDRRTGTGRYTKHQSGTTAASSTDHWRARADFEAAMGGTTHPHLPPHSGSGGGGGTHMSPHNQASAGTENYRREQHVKQQSPVYLVRMRGRYRLEAHKFHRRLFGKASSAGRFFSDPITGDVYAEISQQQVAELRARIVAAQRGDARLTRGAWATADDEQSFDLGGLLAKAADDRLDAARAYQGVGRDIRTEIGGDRPLVLTADSTGMAVRTFRAVLAWAAPTTRSDFEAARAADPGLDVPGSMRRFEHYLRDLSRMSDPAATDQTAQRAMLSLAVRIRADLDAARVNDPGIADPPSLRTYEDHLGAMDQAPLTLPGAIEDAVEVILKEVDRIHSLNPANPHGAPVTLPRAVSVLGLDPVYVARDVAQELNAHVRLDLIHPDGRTSTWIDPDGRVYALDPATFDGSVLTADRAQEAGLLPEHLRPDVDALGISGTDLGRIYRTSWSGRRTFEQALAAEIARRHANLNLLDSRLPGLLLRARDAQAFWQGRAGRLEAQQNDIEREIADARRDLDRVESRITGFRAQILDLVEERVYEDQTQRSRLATRIEEREASVRNLEIRRKNLEDRLSAHAERAQTIAAELATVRAGEQESARFVADLRAAAREPTGAVADRWSDTGIAEAHKRLGDLDIARRVDPSSRQAPSPGMSRPRALRRDALSALVDDVAARLDGTDPELCLRRLDALSRSLYPGGMRTATVTDDSVARGRGTVEQLFTTGFEGARVGSWHAVRAAVERAGPGSTAFVLWRRPQGIGHAFAAYHTSDGGILWLEPQARPGARLRNQPTLHELYARAVVVDGAGHIVPDAVPPIVESSSTGRALIDPPVDRGYGSLPFGGPGGYSDVAYQALSGQPALRPGPGPQYSTADEFDREFADTVDEFPQVIDNDRWMVWGQGDPEAALYVAQSRDLADLRGQYDPVRPRAGRVSDDTGTLYSEGRAWNWYLPGRSGPVASSRFPGAGWTDSGPLSAPVSLASPYLTVTEPPIDPPSIATRPGVFAGGLPHPMRWRSGDDHSAVFRFDESDPEQVFRDGLVPRGDALVHLLDHVYNNPPDSAYVSTSRSRHYVRDSIRHNPFAAQALGRYRYRYDLQVLGGIEVNATLDIASPFPDQLEIAFPGGVDPRFVRRAQHLENGMPVGPYIANPGFDPTLR